MTLVSCVTQNPKLKFGDKSSTPKMHKKKYSQDQIKNFHTRIWMDLNFSHFQKYTVSARSFVIVTLAWGY